jgi:UDP-glucose 4-epimerase
MDKKRVLVTGGTGFIGRCLVDHLYDAGLVVDIGTRSIETSKRPGFIFLDLENPASIIGLEVGAPYDVVVHFGAKIGWTGENSAELYIPNVLATDCLVYLANRWKAHFVFASAAIVAGSTVQHIDKNVADNPDHAYTKSKWIAEQIIISSNVPSCILRVGGVFGINGPHHLGLNRVIDGAINGVPPTQFGDGKALRNYIYVHDVARAIISVIRDKLTGMHLMAGHESISIKEMMEGVCQTFLPHLSPTLKDAPGGSSQLIEPSKSLPKTRCFNDALLDIRQSLQ